MPQWMQDLFMGWPMIRSNLPTFFVILALVITTVWVVVNFTYSGVLASKNAQIELQDRQIADFKQKLVGAPPDQAKAKIDSISAKTSAADPLIKDARIEWDDNGDVWLTGAYAKSGKELIAYIAAFSANTFNTMGGYPYKVIAPSAAAALPRGPRIDIGNVGRFDVDSRARIKLATLSKSGDWILQWGQSADNQNRSGASYGSFFGSIFLVDADHNEYAFPFAIVARKTDQNFPPPVIIGPDIFRLQQALILEFKK